jgi:hypothetical protein
LKGRYTSKKLMIVIPIMILVAVLAMWMLGKEYAEIDLPMRLMISVGAAVLSGVISYFLFAFEKDK